MHRKTARPHRQKRAKWDAAALGLLLSWMLAETGGNLRGHVNADENRRAFLAFATRHGASLADAVPDVRAWRSLRIALRDRLKACPGFRAALAPILETLAGKRETERLRRKYARRRKDAERKKQARRRINPFPRRYRRKWRRW